jgi:hypothetical protein
MLEARRDAAAIANAAIAPTLHETALASAFVNHGDTKNTNAAPKSKPTTTHATITSSAGTRGAGVANAASASFGTYADMASRHRARKLASLSRSTNQRRLRCTP